MSELIISEYFTDNKSKCPRQKEVVFLKEMAQKFDLSHITYFRMGGQFLEETGYELYTTYPDDWKEHYFSSNYNDIDPVVTNGMKGFLPLDWSEISVTDKKEKVFFGEAKEFGIPEHGLTIPVRGSFGDLALFSINSDLSARDWIDYRELRISDIVYFAHLFHCEMINRRLSSCDSEPVSLTRRERQVLTWASRGKTCWETAKILNLKERTIDFYLRNAAVKLKAVSKTQAVANAIAGNHIFVNVISNPALQDSPD